ncbi:MAG: glycosyltransferase family 4 protein [Bacteroidaceae bacterium]|nr:glycosyltransferase family 4 protein [Bacteroidaceae bacterium]
MKILFIHNNYIKPSGEEAASGELARLMEEHGHEVRWFRKSSADIHGTSGKLKAFWLGIYNPKASSELAFVLDEFKPDVVQVQNLYPFISTSIFKPLKRRGIPVVMRCPNYRLFCPNGLCLDKVGKVCEKCFGEGHEFWCAYNNCERNRMKSIGYALRGWYARKSRNILDGVNVFIVQSEFQRRKFIEQDIKEERLAIVPGIAPSVDAPKEWLAGEYVGFVGRVSVEKGIDEFIEAARMNPDLPFKVAGNVDVTYRVPDGLPKNVEFVGFLKGKELDEFYLKSRIIVVPSKWYEGFPNVIVRGMLLGRPIITTNIGAMQSIINNGKNGILVPPADGKALGLAIKKLYTDVDMCKRFANQSIKDTADKYSRERIYEILIGIYKNLI